MRERRTRGLLPSFFGYVHPTRRMPINAIVTFPASALLIIGGWGLGHLLGPDDTPMNPVVSNLRSERIQHT